MTIVCAFPLKMLEYCAIVDESKLRLAVSTSQAILITDGSFHPELRLVTSAFKIENKDGEALAYGYSRTPSHVDLLDAYQAELWGILVSSRIRQWINFIVM